MFSGWSEKQDGRPGFWLAETFLTSPLRMLIWIEWNLTGSKVSTCSTNILFLDQTGKEDSRHSLWLADTLPSFCFSWPIGKPRWLPWPICHQRWHIVLRCTTCGPCGLVHVHEWGRVQGLKPHVIICFVSVSSFSGFCQDLISPQYQSWLYRGRNYIQRIVHIVNGVQII